MLHTSVAGAALGLFGGSWIYEVRKSYITLRALAGVADAHNLSSAESFEGGRKFLPPDPRLVS